MNPVTYTSMKLDIINRVAQLGPITGWILGDGERMAQMHPETFEIPDRHEREDLLPSQYVKLVFYPVKDGQPIDVPAERMWVRVSRMERKDGQVRYAGVLDNDPEVFPEAVLKAGTRVDFGPEHILNIHDAD